MKKIRMRKIKCRDKVRWGICGALVCFCLLLGGCSLSNGVETKTTNQSQYDIVFTKKNYSSWEQKLYTSTESMVTVSVTSEGGKVAVTLENEEGDVYVSKGKILTDATFTTGVKSGPVYVTIKGAKFKGEVNVKIIDSDESSEEVSESVEDESQSEMPVDTIAERVVYAGAVSKKFEYDMGEKATEFSENYLTWFEDLEGDTEEKKKTANSKLDYEDLISDSEVLERNGNQVISIEKAKVIAIEEIKIDGKGRITLIEVTDKKGNGDSYIVYIDQEVSDIELDDTLTIYGIPIGTGTVYDDPNQGCIQALAVLCCYYKE